MSVGIYLFFLTTRFLVSSRVPFYFHLRWGQDKKKIKNNIENIIEKRKRPRHRDGGVRVITCPARLGSQ